jgi:transposase InsO family protein
MSRQNYYRQRLVRREWTADERLVLDLVRQERSRQPRLGGRKLLYLVRPEFDHAQVRLGRDRFFALLRRHDLLILRRRRGVRTTNSRHGFAIYPNTAKDMKLTGSHQLLVSDVTYIRTMDGFMYVALVTDAYSRKIVGYDSSESLGVEGALRALNMALKQMPAGSRGTHHSDRGIQYCCRPYIERLQKAGLRISMTEENHCYENSLAERANGILKQEYGLGETFRTKTEVPSAVKEAVHLYNRHRPHTALGYKTPEHIHGLNDAAA